MNARLCVLCLLGAVAACTAARPSEPARSVLLVTIDTLRADHVGAYGATTARTPSLDGLAREGARFDRAWAPAPITLPSHATLLSGLYPPAHGARHNGMAMHEVPTLATVFKSAGFATGAFVSAFPLDRRFGLSRGFDDYDDQLPRGADGRPLNERQGEVTVSRALAWLQAHADQRFFLWVHLFEPHAPYGTPGSGQPAQTRYDDDIAIADRELGRLLAALGSRAATTMVIATGDHGEAFGEHGEVGHSVFVYDTTLRVPLVMRGPGVRPGTVVPGDVSLVDLAATLTTLTGTAAMAGDGQSLVPALGGDALPSRPVYAESFAPLFDFGWAGLRTVREGPWKYIAAPRAELYDLGRDPAETVNRIGEEPALLARLDGEITRRSPAEPGAPSMSPEAAARLRSLGYLGGGARPAGAAVRPDPKDRISVASRLATVTSGEVRGDQLVATLEAILRDDPPNPQAHLRLGFAQVERGRCDQAEPHLRAALEAGVPSADAGLGLATCFGQAGNLTAAREALLAARRAEPGNPVVAANLGILELAQGRDRDAIVELRTALAAEPGLLEARFALARALARSGDREGAAREANTLLGQLPPDAPQRAEVRRLLDALR